MRLSTYILRVLTLLWLLTVAVGVLVFAGIQVNTRDTRLAARLQTEDKQVDEIRGNIVDLETGVRGFVITGDETFLEPYHGAAERLPVLFAQFGTLLGPAEDDSGRAGWRRLQGARVLELVQRWKQQVALPEIQARHLSAEGAAALVKSRVGKKLVDQMRSVLAAVQQDIRQEARLVERHADHTLRLVQGLTLLGLTTLVLASWLAGALLTRRLSGTFGRLAAATRRFASGELHERAPASTLHEAQELAQDFNAMASALSRAQHEAHERQQVLERRNWESTRLSELSDTLQASYTLQEGFAALEHAMPHLFPGWSGAVSVIAASRNLMEVRAQWGGSEWRVHEPSAGLDQCWALRRGGPYSNDSPLKMPCIQQAPGSARPYLCLPLLAQGEAVGILRLGAEEDLAAGEVQAVRAYAQLTARQIALAIANLQLRETLRHQSVRDSLTGLFNRRYLEETLAREVQRAERRQGQLCVLALDIDHFKRFNDTFGHDGGDAMLLAVARQMKAFFRAEDVVCRYGGEEFVVVLLDVSPADALARAEDFRRSVSALQVRHQGASLGQVTVSLGVAAFPTSTTDAGRLVALADAALYQAKNAGRNRVVLHAAGEPREAQPGSASSG